MKTKSADQIGYADEASIDKRDDDPYGYCEIGHGKLTSLTSIPQGKSSAQRFFQVG
ncbi:hypothetical protein [Leptodesmis sp.]|uniref:hypothetical protein n=1 Tax=Leptodesmis sp. TaxID=3100501 RepID=UPI0040534ABE